MSQQPCGVVVCDGMSRQHIALPVVLGWPNRIVGLRVAHRVIHYLRVCVACVLMHVWAAFHSMLQALHSIIPPVCKLAIAMSTARAKSC